MTILDIAISELHRYRQMAGDSDEKHFRSEYAYAMISLLMESQQIFSEQKFAEEFIQEKCTTLGRLAEYIKREDRGGKY